MRRIGLSAAGLLAAFTLALTIATAGRATAPLAHTCSATDRQFIETAKTNMAAISLWGQEYLSGDAPAGDVVTEANAAAKILHGTAPTDPTLSQARGLLVGMFTEYGKAIHAKARHGDAGSHMYRAYGLANFAHTILGTAEQPLARRGCDVEPLL